MPSFKKPQKPENHSNSKRARRALEEWLPDEWNFSKNVDDDDSGYEWGEDWIIEIVDGGQVLGAKFSIQSKVLSGKDAVNSQGIGTKIAISTINRLFEMTYPILFHFVYGQKSYVMWLDEWMGHQSDLSWRNKLDGEITIRISNIPDNELSDNKIEQIKQYVLLYYFQQGNYKVVDIINRTSKDHYVELLKTQEGTEYLIHPLHDSAIPHISLLDEESIQSFQQVIDTGLPTQISGKFEFSNIPSLLLQQMKSLEMLTLVVSNTLTIDRTLVFSWDIQDKDGKLLYKINQVDMKLVQLGQKIIKFQGNSFIDGISLSIIFSPEDTTNVSINFEIMQTSLTPIVGLNTLRFLRAMQKVEYINVNELTLGISFGSSFVDSFRFDIAEAIPDSEIYLAEALVEITQRLKKPIEFPKRYRPQDIVIAEILLQILKTGRIAGCSDYGDVIGEGRVSIARQALTSILKQHSDCKEKGEEFRLIIPPDEPIFELCENRFQVGKRTVVLNITNIGKSSDEILTLPSGQEIVEIPVEFDLEKSFSIYKDWCSEEERKEYFAHND